jgi:hypothetical protein
MSDNEPPKLYTSSEAVAAEWRKMYPNVEIVMTPDKIPTNTICPHCWATNGHQPGCKDWGFK